MKACIFLINTILLSLSFDSISKTVLPTKTPKIAIIIDDIGYRKTDFSALALAGQFTYSVVPYAPFTQKMAQLAHDSNREVMGHIPMEALSNNHLLGKGALRLSMNEEETRAQVRDILANIPFISGINNHMGSHFTTKFENLSWMMDELAKKDLYFLDSKTTVYSMAERAAVKYGVPTGHRHVFLDNNLDTAYLSQQFNKLIEIAKKYNQAVAIAHPHPQSIAFLQGKSEYLKSIGIDLVPVSSLLPEMTRLAQGSHIRNPVNKRFKAATVMVD